MNPSIKTTTPEAMMALPTRALVGSMLGIALLVSLTWFAITGIGHWPTSVQVSGFVGGLVVATVSILSVLIMAPWKARPISGWMTMWLLGALVRLFLTPAVTFVLYSAAPLNAGALALAVASTYMAVLLAEALVLTAHFSHRRSRHDGEPPLRGDREIQQGS